VDFAQTNMTRISRELETRKGGYPERRFFRCSARFRFALHFLSSFRSHLLSIISPLTIFSLFFLSMARPSGERIVLNLPWHREIFFPPSSYSQVPTAPLLFFDVFPSQNLFP